MNFWRNCPACNGEGNILRRPFSSPSLYVECPRCQGQGGIPTCAGRYVLKALQLPTQYTEKTKQKLREVPWPLIGMEIAKLWIERVLTVLDIDSILLLFLLSLIIVWYICAQNTPPKKHPESE